MALENRYIVGLVAYVTVIVLVLLLLNFTSDGPDETIVIPELPNATLQLEWNTSLEEFMGPLRKKLIKDKYTVLIPTYRRDDVLSSTLRFHCSCKHVDRIIVVWNNVHETIPKHMTQFPCRVRVVFLRQIMNSLNNRFKPYRQIRTEGVLVMDDDRLQTPEDIELAFMSWKKHKHLLVGFQAYTHGYNKSTGQYYLENKSDHRPSFQKNRTAHSIILTTSTFIDVFYLMLYTAYMPSNIREFVDTKFNGEDIAMNFMIAQHLYETTGHVQRSCLWVQGTSTHLEWSAKRFHGINHVLKHFHAERNELLNLLVKEYGRMALQKSNSVIYNNGASNTLHHAT